MISISIIGSGNVAQHLISALSKAENIELKQAFTRQKNTLTHLLDSDKIIDDYSELLPVDVIIIAVADNAISEVSRQILLKNQLIVHTSGSISIDDLQSHRKGVFYPLQTFSKSKAVDFKTIPICLEAQNQEDYKTIEAVAQSISDCIYKVDSQQRKALHVAAVFVSNFVNHLYLMGNEICNENQLPFDILKPLIQETAIKILTLSPQDAQTGPAQRGDTVTINTHLAFLTDTNQKEMYKLLTKSIIDHGKKL
ncbi:Rossmann-like and DUF2520 domain-containing protein [Flavobacterium sedimenticola]|uniref:DUF2520 domain-containing protein n=1 Tax=Flavobacterium sedimenticola TaxID=3043286 RepID=A0ABT6XTE7_9FLAO|nr:DUF2520 domain-containing protein [Flavobacterium sedimenticola]MDI9258372.1 DUF2520 domain-containing protein [Flavobacterium sedimenticola]